jgi:two-component sensor histidine kinase
MDGGGQPNVTLDWHESDGPPVKKPKHRGFGKELIEREVQGTLGGTVAFDYPAGGFQARIIIPLNAKEGAGAPG